MRTFYLLHNLLHHEEHTPNTLTLLYLIYVIRTAVFTYLAVFLPYYYYQNFVDLGFKESNSIYLTLIVFAVFQIAHMIATFWGTRISHSGSIKQLFFISSLILFFNTLLLSFSQNLVSSLISGLAFGLHGGMWWLAYHLEFAIAERKQNFGKAVGLRQAFGILTGVAMTVISGLIISRYGYQAMYLATSLLVMMMMVLIIMLKDHNLKASFFSFRLMKHETRKYPADFITYASVGAESFVAEIIWPLLLFVVFVKPITVGLIASGVTILAFVIRVFAGNLTDRLKHQRVENFGVVAVSLAWFGKLISQHPFSLMLFDSFYRIFSAFYYVPATALNYIRSLVENKTVYIASREIVGMLGKTLALILALILLVLGVPFWWLLAIGTLVPLLSLIVKQPVLRK